MAALDHAAQFGFKKKTLDQNKKSFRLLVFSIFQKFLQNASPFSIYSPPRIRISIKLQWIINYSPLLKTSTKIV